MHAQGFSLFYFKLLLESEKGELWISKKYIKDDMPASFD